MKKKIMFALALMLTATSLTACGKKEEALKETNNVEIVQPQVSEAKPAEDTKSEDEENQNGAVQTDENGKPKPKAPVVNSDLTLVPEVDNNIDNSVKLNIITANTRQIDILGNTIEGVLGNKGSATALYITGVNSYSIPHSNMLDLYEDYGYYFSGYETTAGCLAIEAAINGELVDTKQPIGDALFESFSQSYVKGVSAGYDKLDGKSPDYITFTGGIHVNMYKGEIEEIYGRGHTEKKNLGEGDTLGHTFVYYKNDTATMIICYKNELDENDAEYKAERITVILN